MLSDSQVREIYKHSETIAVYGMSRDPAKPAQFVPAMLKDKGFTIIPINPAAQEILGLKSFPTLDSIPDKIDVLDVFRPSAEAYDVVRQAVERHKDKGDIRVIWLQEGIENDEAKALAEQAGIIFIQNHCMRKEYLRLFPKDVAR